jgi:hypothetical protein
MYPHLAIPNSRSQFSPTPTLYVGLGSLPPSFHLARLDGLALQLHLMEPERCILSRESATIFGKGTIPEPSVSHIGQGVALVAQGVAFVYI